MRVNPTGLQIFLISLKTFLQRGIVLATCIACLFTTFIAGLHFVILNSFSHYLSSGTGTSEESLLLPRGSV